MAGEGLNYESLAQSVEQVREVMKAMVAGLVADGFSDEQARDIIAGLWRSAGKPDDD